MKNSVKIVFWDWLGTLVSSHFNLKFYLQEIRSQNSNGISSLQLDDSNKLTQEEIAQLRNMIAKKGEVWIPYAWSLVNSFASKKVRQVIVSNGNYDSIAKNVSHSPFDRFDMILTSSKFPPKPSAEMIEYALEKFNLKPEQAILIGDAPVDMQTAKNTQVQYYQVDGSLESYLKIANQFKFCC